MVHLRQKQVTMRYFHRKSILSVMWSTRNNGVEMYIQLIWYYEEYSWLECITVRNVWFRIQCKINFTRSVWITGEIWKAIIKIKNALSIHHPHPQDFYVELKKFVFMVFRIVYCHFAINNWLTFIDRFVSFIFIRILLFLS